MYFLCIQPDCQRSMHATKRIPRETLAAAGLETCMAALAKFAHAQAKNEELVEKNLPGRPYSAPAEARSEFCYHSLNEDLVFHPTPLDALCGSSRGKTLEIGDSLRISE